MSEFNFKEELKALEIKATNARNRLMSELGQKVLKQAKFKAGDKIYSSPLKMGVWIERISWSYFSNDYTIRYHGLPLKKDGTPRVKSNTETICESDTVILIEKRKER